MDRLTYKSSMGDYGNDKEFEDDWAEKCSYRNALGKYEDLGMTAEELAPYVPTFPIGSTVYQIYSGKVYPIKVHGFSIAFGNRKYRLYASHTSEDGQFTLYVNDWVPENEIYKTEKEAMRALGGTYENKK